MDFFDSINWTRSLVILAVIAVVVMLVATGFFLLRLLAKFRVVHSELMPVGGRVAFWGALAYTLMPFDLLPDTFLLLIDDIGVLAMALVYINSLRGDDEPGDGPPLLEPEQLG